MSILPSGDAAVFRGARLDPTACPHYARTLWGALGRAMELQVRDMFVRKIRAENSCRSISVERNIRPNDARDYRPGICYV